MTRATFVLRRRYAAMLARLRRNARLYYTLAAELDRGRR